MYFVGYEYASLLFSMGETCLAIPTTAFGRQRINVSFKDNTLHFHSAPLSASSQRRARILFVLLLPIMPIITLVGCICYYSSTQYTYLRKSYQAYQACEARFPKTRLEESSWSPPPLEPHELDLVSLDDIDEKNYLQAVWEDKSKMPSLNIGYRNYFYPASRPNIVMTSIIPAQTAYRAFAAEKRVYEFIKDRGFGFLRLAKRTLLEGGCAQERLASRGEVLSDLFLYQQDSAKFDDAIEQLASLLMHFSSEQMLSGQYEFALHLLRHDYNNYNQPVFLDMPDYRKMPLFLSEGKGCIGLCACGDFEEGFNEKSYAALYALFPLHHDFLNTFKQKFGLNVDQKLIEQRIEMGTSLLEQAVLGHKKWLDAHNIDINSEPELPISEKEQEVLVDLICKQFTKLLNQSVPSEFSALSREEKARAHTIAGDSNSARALVTRFTQTLQKELKNAHNIIPIPLQGEYEEPGDAFARRTVYIQIRPFLQKIGLPEEGDLARIEPNRKVGRWCQWLLTLVSPAIDALCDMKKLYDVSCFYNLGREPEAKLGIRY